MAEQKDRATRESVDDWFSARIAANRSKRANPVTADDIRARAAGRQSTGRGRGVLARAVPVVIGCGFLVAAGVIGVTTAASTQTFAIDRAVLEQEIVLAQSDLDALPAADASSAEAYTATVAEQVAAAEDAGVAIAALQQEYAQLLFTGNEEDADDNGPQLAYEKALSHQETLAPYFDPDTFIADSGDSLGDRDIDPRFPWFIGYEADGATVVDPSASSWTLIGVSATDTAGVLEVTWANRSAETGHLFAWATADYDAEQELFGVLTVGKTTLGDRSATEIQLSRK